MILQFRIQKIKPKSPLAQKLQSVDQKTEIHRILAKVTFIKPDSSSTIAIDAIFDTGAIFSLFPGTLLNEYPDIKYETHTLWGIVDAPECQVKTRMATVPIKLIDNEGNESPILTILGAFSEITDIPALLGMKNLLVRYPYHFDPIEETFTLLDLILKFYRVRILSDRKIFKESRLLSAFDSK